MITSRTIPKREFVGSDRARARLNTTRVRGTPVAPVKAARTTALAGGNNDMVFTAKDFGAAYNAASIAYVNPGTASAALAITVLAYAITVSLATDAGVAASYTTSLTGSNNDMVFTAKAIGTGGNAITIAYVDPSANDAALSIGVVGNAITVNLATNSGGAITSTAAQIKTAIEGNTAANALVSVANAAANDGSGVVTALAAQNLANGAGIAITSTAAQIKTAIEGNTAANAIVAITNAGGNDGSGVVTAMAASLLTGGVDGTSGNDGDELFDDDYLYVSHGESTYAVSNWLKYEGQAL